jgi:hypothetical protein
MKNPDAWGPAVAALAAAPERFKRPGIGIRPPWTMDDLACDMAEPYRTLLADARG